ncbi:hypothetical protein [Dongia sp.]|uniref:hypothetical protein n=1 Tax=Dongia sp. TaxID=1977262 RepID=UPI0035AE748F
MSPPLEKVYQLFPDRAFLVTQLAHRSEGFFALCEEYDLAVSALQQLEARGAHAAADLLHMAEYRALIEELKLDLLRELQASEEASKH